MELSMESFTEILEEELENSFEVKDRKALHRSVLILAEHVVSKEKHGYEYQALRDDIAEVKSDVKVLAETMRQGFESIDKRFVDFNQRFEDMNKRFEDVNQRFNMVISLMSIGFIVTGVLVTVYKFLR